MPRVSKRPRAGLPDGARRTLDAGARIHLTVVTAILAWGVLAFGAVYPWGYRPLAAACALSGMAALMSSRVRRSVPRAVAIALAAVVVAGLLQEVRLSSAIIQRISPATAALLVQYDLAFALQGASAGHALSIDTVRTWTGLFLLASLGLFWIGLSALLDERLTIRIVQAVIALGCLVALIGIAFAGNDSGKVYGVWQPQFRAAPFGTFVNRNHFAGWMLMSALVGFGYFTALLTQAARAGVRSWHQRVVWLSTPEASRLIVVGVALVAMIVSMLLSMSRSGIGCLAFGVATVGFLAGRKVFYGWSRAVYVACLVLLAVALIGQVGADGITARLGTWRDDSLAGRVAAWRDAGALVRRFPVAGTGLNTFGVAMLFQQTSHLDELYAEAHNDYLQLAVEGGVLVGVPVVALLFFTMRDVRRRFRETDRGSHLRWIRVGAVMGMVAVGIQEAGDFSLQMPGNAALFCVLAAIALHRPGRPGTA